MNTAKGQDFRENTFFNIKRSGILLLLGALLSAAVGLITYIVLSRTQRGTFEREYSTMADHIIYSAMSILDKSLYAAQNVAAVYTTQFPDSASWPLVALARFGQIVAPLLSMLNTLNINHIPLIYPHQLADFETFAYDFFASDPEGFEGLGESDFGKGVYWVNATTKERFHDTTGETTFSKYDIITPVFQVGNVRRNAFVVMYNTHNEEVRGLGIDAVIDCVHANNTENSKCAATTDFIYLLQDNKKFNPAAILYYPEFPADNTSHLVGFMGVVFTWDQLLLTTLPPGESAEHLHIVLESFPPAGRPGTTETYDVNHGKIKYMGQGDRSDRQLQRFRRSGEVNTLEGISSTSTTYRLHVVPTRQLYGYYVNDEPIIIGVIISSVIFALVCALVVYEAFEHAKSQNHELAQELRRVYVRWVSHEMRSPLNGVYLAITTLENEFVGLKSKSSMKVTDRLEEEEDEGGDDDNRSVVSLESVVVADLVSEIKLGVENSVNVLNDLLEYSCFDSWRAQNQNFDVWEMMRRATEAFERGAAQRGVSLALVRGESMVARTNSELIDVVEPISDSDIEDHKSEMTVCGDEAALLRAVSSVFRSALKAIAPGEDLHVKVYSEYQDLASGKDLRLCQMWNLAKFKESKSFVVVVFKHKLPEGANNHNSTSFSVVDQSQFNVAKLRTGSHNNLAFWMANSIVRSHGGSLKVLHQDDYVLVSMRLPLLSEKSTESENDAHTRSPRTASSKISLRREAVEEKRSRSFRKVKLSPDEPESDSAPEPIPPAAQSESRKEVSVVTPFKAADPLRKMKILVVDDVLSNRKILSRLLTRRGHSCFLAADGLECIDMVREQAIPGKVQFDAICMDYEMPNCDGPTATKRLREYGFDMPIVGVTGNVLPDDINYFKEQGAVEVLAKPVDVERLEIVLRAHVAVAPPLGVDLTAGVNRSFNSSRQISDLMMPPE